MLLNLHLGMPSNQSTSMTVFYVRAVHKVLYLYCKSNQRSQLGPYHTGSYPAIQTCIIPTPGSPDH